MRNEKGFGIVELLIAIALLAIISIAFFNALSTTSKAIFTTDERATAESLAKSQMEYVKNQLFSASYTPEPISSEYDGYSATITDELIEIDLQKITVTIEHHGEEVITLEGYKANR